MIIIFLSNYSRYNYDHKTRFSLPSSPSLVYEYLPSYVVPERACMRNDKYSEPSMEVKLYCLYYRVYVTLKSGARACTCIIELAQARCKMALRGGSVKFLRIETYKRSELLPLK
jgi:hypothetical protein